MFTAGLWVDDMEVTDVSSHGRILEIFCSKLGSGTKP